MKMKRIIAGAIGLVMLALSIPCFAATETIINPIISSGKNITISGEVPTPKARVYIEVTRKGADILDAQEIYVSRQINAGEEGEFSLNCEMPQYDRKDPTKTIDGYFTVYCITAGTPQASADFSYVTEASRTGFLTALNSSKSAKGLMTFMENEENKIYFDLYNILIDEFYKSSAEKQAVLCGCLEALKDDFTEENITESINYAIITSRLNELADTNAVKEVIDSEEIFSKCDLTFGETTYETVTEEVKNWFYEVVLELSKKNGFTEITQLNNTFDEALALFDVNASHYSKMFDLLKANADVLKLDDSEEYEKMLLLTSSQTENIMKALKGKSSSIKSVDELKELLEVAYSEGLSAGTSSSSGSSSGGSSSGGGSSGGSKGSSQSILSAGSIPTAAQTEENKEEITEEYFSDLSGYDWAKDAINTLAAAGVVSGDGSGSFNPERNVTRAEFLTMLMNAIEMVDEDAACEFEDVPAGDWSYKYIASAYAAGITSGISDTIFGKNNTITRQEAAAFLHRAAVRMYLPLDGDTSHSFADEGEIAEWAIRSVKLMKAAGLINGVGDNCFDPHGVTTRAQAARMIFGLYEKA